MQIKRRYGRIEFLSSASNPEEIRHAVEEMVPDLNSEHWRSMLPNETYKREFWPMRWSYLPMDDVVWVLMNPKALITTSGNPERAFRIGGLSSPQIPDDIEGVRIAGMFTGMLILLTADIHETLVWYGHHDKIKLKVMY